MKQFFYILLLVLVSLDIQAQKVDLQQARKLQMAELAIANFYVDDVDENKLVEEAIIKMLAQLDPHSLYSNPEEVKKLNEPLQGNFDGIGVQFNMVQDTLLVIQAISGGPSEKVGIRAGDRIVAVNDSAIAGVKMKTEEIMRRLRGPRGTKVEMKILRRNVDELLSFTVKRDRIPLRSIDAAYLIRKKIGYIRIDRFGANTHKEFVQALDKLKSQGMENLILDLQGNGGGYLNAAIDLANEFLQAKELIVYTEGRKSSRNDFYAKGNGKFRQGKLAVLIDEFSASASEIVTGAVQDWDRGIVIGRRSYGKGLVQRPIDLPDGSMIRLTIARYYTPSGRCIQKPYESIEQYNHDLIDRYNKGEMCHADSIHFPDSLRYATRKLGRTVYGGGGIMPDYFIPIDTTRFTKYHRELSQKGVLLQTHLQQIELHRREWLKRYPSFEKFETHFIISDELLQNLRQAGEKEKITCTEEEFKQSVPQLKLLLKALIARDLWTMQEYYRIINEKEPVIQEALRLMAGKDFIQRKPITLPLLNN